MVKVSFGYDDEVVEINKHNLLEILNNNFALSYEELMEHLERRASQYNNNIISLTPITVYGECSSCGVYSGSEFNPVNHEYINTYTVYFDDDTDDYICDETSDYIPENTWEGEIRLYICPSCKKWAVCLE